MWKEPSDTPSEMAPPTAPSAAASDPSPQSRRVRIKIIRPDGSSRDIRVAGHFREEHLCSLVDDELCRIGEGEALTLHLFHPDDELTRSLRSRWKEGLSDNRQVFVREVLGPNNNARQLATQLQSIRKRMTDGERVHLAIRSPRVANAARDHLRKLLLISQRFDKALLKVWVHGDDEQQKEILGQLEGAGMVRIQDYEDYVERHSDRRWRAPWLDVDLAKQSRKAKRQQRKRKTSEQEVSDWIKRVEEDRDQAHK
jgi:hypothetical protein